MNARLWYIIVPLTVSLLAGGVSFPFLPALQDHTFGNEAIVLTGVFSGVTGGLQLLLQPVVGALSDRFGRKPMMLASAASALIQAVVLLLSGVNILVYFIVQTALSPLDCLFTLSIAYADDQLPAKRRGPVLARLVALFLLAATIAPLIGSAVANATDTGNGVGAGGTNGSNGIALATMAQSCDSNCTLCSDDACRVSSAQCYVSDACSPIPPFKIALWLSVGLSVVCVISLTVLRETVGSAQLAEWSWKKFNPLSVFQQVVAVFWRGRHVDRGLGGRLARRLFLVSFFYNVTLSGSVNALFLYLVQNFAGAANDNVCILPNVCASQLSLLVLMIGVGGLISQGVVLPLLIHWGVQYRTLLFGFIALHAGHLIALAFVANFSAVYVVLIVGGLSASASPVMKVLLLDYVGRQEKGASLGVLNGLEALTGIFAPVLMGLLFLPSVQSSSWAKAVSGAAPGWPFIAAALPEFASLAIVLLLQNPLLDDEEGPQPSAAHNSAGVGRFDEEESEPLLRTEAP